MSDFELLDNSVNAVVARYVQREFPGMLIQGDTLRTFLDDVEELEQAASSGDLEEVCGVSATLKERLVELLCHYEHILLRNNYDLPYKNSVLHHD